MLESASHDVYAYDRNAAVVENSKSRYNGLLFGKTAIGAGLENPFMELSSTTSTILFGLAGCFSSTSGN